MLATNSAMDSYTIEDRKNIKNIYVQKINSLMKLSKDTLLKDDFQNSNHHEKKKIRKIASQIDKNTLKLEKNRQSAKKARLRKKIYIKMLESQIECFKRIKAQGDQLNQESQAFLQNKKNLIKDYEMNEIIEQDVNVDKFLSGSDLGQVIKIQNKEFQKKFKQRDVVVEQLYQLSTSSLIKKLKTTKNLQVFQPILKKQTRQNMKGFQNLIKRISHHYDIIKNSFRKIHQLTQTSKKLSRSCHNKHIDDYDLSKFSLDLTSVSQFMQKLDLNRQLQYDEQPNDKNISIQPQMYNSMQQQQKNIVINNDLNLHSTEKLLIRSQKFFQHTLFEDQQ